MDHMSKLCHIDIPSYSFKQEKFNSISHLAGIPIGIATIIASSCLFAFRKLSSPFFIGLIIFGLTTIILYLISGLYHLTNPEMETAKKLLRIIDHCTIYVLIAGTYTPICIYLFDKTILGLITLILEWSFALIGILINAINLTNKWVKIISMILYLVMGWLLLFTGMFIYLPTIPFILILIGGLSYTVGSITYGIGHKKLSFHSIFHIFVLIGTIIQAIGVILIFIIMS